VEDPLRLLRCFGSCAPAFCIEFALPVTFRSVALLRPACPSLRTGVATRSQEAQLLGVPRVLRPQQRRPHTRHTLPSYRPCPAEAQARHSRLVQQQTRVFGKPVSANSPRRSAGAPTPLAIIRQRVLGIPITQAVPRLAKRHPSSSRTIRRRMVCSTPPLR
jgi:hypothetical protein